MFRVKPIEEDKSMIEQGVVKKLVSAYEGAGLVSYLDKFGLTRELVDVLWVYLKQSGNLIAAPMTAESLCQAAGYPIEEIIVRDDKMQERLKELEKKFDS